MNQLMILTGNSTNRIPQLYFNNPNTSYGVQIDIMVAVIDDNYSFFPDTVNQTGLSFYNLQCNLTLNCIETFVTNESIVIYDTNTPRNALVYLTLVNISSLNISQDLIVIDEQTLGKIFLQFVSVADAKQGYSLITYAIQNNGVVIQSLNPVVDIYSPIVYFYNQVGNTASGSYIMLNGQSDGPYNTGLTTSSMTFSTSISLSTFGTENQVLTKSILSNILIDNVVDNRDGVIITDCADIILYDYSLSVVESIPIIGTYSLYFNISDIAGNYVNPSTNVMLNITT